MNTRDPWANLSAAFASEFGSAVQWTPEQAFMLAEALETLIGAMATAVAGNRLELDAAAEEYAREQMASAQDTPEQGYSFEETK